jgi:hypothetical protein
LKTFNKWIKITIISNLYKEFRHIIEIVKNIENLYINIQIVPIKGLLWHRNDPSYILKRIFCACQSFCAVRSLSDSHMI